MVTQGQKPPSKFSHLVCEDKSLYELKKLGFSLPNPLDRLAANVIDGFIVLSPFLLVLMAPFKKMLREAVLLGSSSNLILSSVLCILTVLFFSFIYKVCLTWCYGGTLGQLFMSLRVVDIWEPEKRKLGNHLLRSAYWVFSYLLLCLPFLSIMSNERRRCFHDRVSDTVVLSLKGSIYPRPSFIEKGLARLTLVCVFFIGVVGFSPQLYSLYMDFQRQDSWAQFLEEETLLCSSVETNLSKWPEENPTRLSIAMALYAAGEIEKSCLKREVDFIYRSGLESGMAALASAFIYADNAELSDKYLKVVCENYPDSESCQMGRIIELWNENNGVEISSLFEEFGSTRSVYVTVWGILHFYRNNQYEKAMEVLKSITHVRRLADFLGLQTVKLHWASLREHEARISAETAMTAMSERGRLSLSNWLCFEEREKSCRRHGSCDYMIDYWDQHPKSLENDELALTFLKDSACKNKDYADVKKKIPKGLINDLATALDSKGKKRSLENYLNKNQLTPRLKAEVLRELISIDSIKDLEGRTLDWLVAEEGREWEKTGRVLFERLFQLRVWSQAYEVGLALLNWQPRDFQLQEGLVVAAYRAKKVNQASRILSNYYRKKKSNLYRSPASRSSFSRVVRQLESLESQ